jgi:hypothetical protein
MPTCDSDMSLLWAVTSCLQNVSTRVDFRENRHADTLCQAKKTLYLRFIGRDFRLVVLCPSAEFFRTAEVMAIRVQLPSVPRTVSVPPCDKAYMDDVDSRAEDHMGNETLYRPLTKE